MIYDFLSIFGRIIGALKSPALLQRKELVTCFKVTCLLVEWKSTRSGNRKEDRRFDSCKGALGFFPSIPESTSTKKSLQC